MNTRPSREVPERLRSVLAATLHDPTLQLASWLPERHVYVDPASAPVHVAPARDRALTYLERDGEQIAGAGARPALDALSAREREVLAVMAESRSNQAICERLFLSPKTVEAYVPTCSRSWTCTPVATSNRRMLAVLAHLRA